MKKRKLFNLNYSKNNNIYNYNLVIESESETFKSIDSFELMKKAAKSCFEYITKNMHFTNTLILCGPGNNGGDGLLIAKFFNENKMDVTIYSPLGVGKTKDSKKAFNLLEKKNLFKKKIIINEYDLIIDCLFGVGFNRSFSKDLSFFINELNQSQSNIVSIDMPSGVYTDSGAIHSIAVKANKTLTFHRLKPGLILLPGKEFSGSIEILDIGISNLDNKTNIHLLHPPKLKEINKTDHKYKRGTTYIIAGKELIGASKLATLAASQSSLRIGAGVSKILINESDINYFKPHILEEMIVRYHNIDDLKNQIQNLNIDSLIYGCGIEISEQNKELLSFLLIQSFKIVLDASAFSLMTKDKNLFIKLLYNRNCKTVLTPHKGEFEKIFSTSENKLNDCLNAAKKTNSIILYKGNDTIIASPESNIYINNIGSPNLATSGSGDVLAGIIGGLLSQDYSILEATKLGCYIHSECGNRLGRGLIASDLIAEIPNILKEMMLSN